MKGKAKRKMTDVIFQELQEAHNVLDQFLSNRSNLLSIAGAAELIAAQIPLGGKVMACGNGGSHCDAMHFAEEMTGRFRKDRKPLPAIAISDASHITCTANDYGFEHIFSRYIEALGKKEDVLLVMSTSGNSSNILKAVEAAHLLGMKVVALTGNDGGLLSNVADIEIRVPHFGTSDRIQEIHIKVIHILIQLIENLST